MPHGLLALFSMNALNIITARVSTPPSPAQARPNAVAVGADVASDDKSREPSDHDDGHGLEDRSGDDEKAAAATEESPLLDTGRDGNRRAGWWHALPRSLASSIISSIRWIFATLASPGVYLMACFCDEQGNFAPMTQLKRLFGVRRGGLADKDYAPASTWGPRSMGLAQRPALSSASSTGSSTSGASSESEAESEETGDGKGKHGRSDKAGTAQRSIRIKLHSDEGLGQRKHRRAQSAAKASDEELSAQLKSPTSPVAALTKYPKTPAPPRPLIPRRQPSYINVEAPPKQQKTLILDLDETIIHSMSKGGRMSTGHMVEVRLNTASLGMGGAGGAAAQLPILYWVNKRPYCDEFLRRVCKWFNLVIFTASVQEYADPVIDWLESERKFFSARYYRQHCTYRQGAYIKDLSTVEPDLSKVMILDNSPLSYLFHQDNAIPIQGWINDPTDSDLMHLVPLLEGLHYVHDVRALLALRGG